MTQIKNGAPDAPQQPAARSRRDLLLQLADLGRQRAAIESAISLAHAQLADLEEDIPLPSELLGLDAAAAIAGVSKRVLWAECRRGRLEVLGAKKRRRVRRDELMRWMSTPARAEAPANDADGDERASARAAVEMHAAKLARRGA